MTFFVFCHTTLCVAAQIMPDYAGIRVENEVLILIPPKPSTSESAQLFLKTLPFVISDLQAVWMGNAEHFILEDFSACILSIPIKGRLEYQCLGTPSDWFFKIQITECGGDVLDLQSFWNQICPLPVQMKEGFFLPKNRGIEIEICSNNGLKEQFLRIEGTLFDASLEGSWAGVEIVDLHGDILFDQKQQQLIFSQIQASFLCGKKLKEYLLWGEKIHLHGHDFEEAEFQLALLRNQKELVKMQGRVSAGIGQEKTVLLDMLQSHVLQTKLSSFALYLDPKDLSWHLNFSALPDIKQVRAVYREGKIEIEQLFYRSMELFGQIAPHQETWALSSLGIEIAPFLLLGLEGEWILAEERGNGSIKHCSINLDKSPLLQEFSSTGMFMGEGEWAFSYSNIPSITFCLHPHLPDTIVTEIAGTIAPHSKGWQILDCRYATLHGDFFSPEILLEPVNSRYTISCLQATCLNWTPNIGKSTLWHGKLLIPSMSIQNFSAQLNDLSTWQGEGSLLFKICSLEEFFDGSTPFWAPCQGKIFYSIRDGTVWLLRLKDGFNQKKSLKISLNSSERSWVDFKGRLALYLRLKTQNPLLKSLESFSIALKGDMQHVECSKQEPKKQHSLPRAIKKITQSRKREK